VVLGCGVIVVATWLPWVSSRAVPVPIDGFGLLTPARDAWTALHTLAVLLVLGALATAGAALIGLAFRWRAVFLAVAVAGWLESAFAVAGAPYPSHAGLLSAVQPSTAHGAGYYACLAGAALAVLGGLSGALTEPAGGG
jgi:hypothetical protein